MSAIRKIRVLIVEDSMVNQKLLVGLLAEDPDFEVIGIVSNGAEAVEFVAGNKPDVISMDINMPVMDGYEAMRIIRKTPGIQNTPIICLTAKAMKEDHENALSNGANDYLSKPLNEDKLFAMLKIWLYKK